MVNALATYRRRGIVSNLAKRITERSKGLLEPRGYCAEGLRRHAEPTYNDAMTDVQNSLQPLKIFGITQREIDDAERQGEPVNTELAVRSPIDGTVVQKLVTPGLVDSGRIRPECFLISRVGTVWVQGHIFDQRPAQCAPGRCGGPDQSQLPRDVSGKDRLYWRAGRS